MGDIGPHPTDGDHQIRKTEDKVQAGSASNEAPIVASHQSNAAGTGTKEDALSVLMRTAKRSQQNKKRRRQTDGSFVDCPAGCGKQVLESLINVHLDRCPILQGNSQLRRAGSDPVETHLASPNDAPGVPCENAVAVVQHRGESLAQARESPPRSTLVTQDALTSAEKPCQAPLDIDNETPKELTTATDGHQCPAIDSDVFASAPGDCTSECRSLPIPVQGEDSTTSTRDPAEDSTSKVSAGIEVVQGIPTPSSPKHSQPAPSAGSSPCLKQPGLHMPPRTEKVLSGRSNVFSVMMERAKVLDSRQYATSKAAAVAMADAQPLQQCLYLSNEGLHVTLFEGTAKPPPAFPVVWSAVVVLKDRHVELAPSNVNCDSNPPVPVSRISIRRPVELTIATNVPSADATHYGQAPATRFVRHHSRLSVPVLKSILQKSVRRRRPLPSVRVAMELADKSFGDLVRRLPVIAMEDSMLHPDLDLLVWLMVAHSKEYVAPSAIMTRLFQIVFEVASCQWKDDDQLRAPEEVPTTSFGSANNLSLNTLHHMTLTEPPSTADNVRLSHRLVWSLLVRADYGGMRCDLEMLHRFARLWQARFRCLGVPAELASRWGLSKENASTISWRDVPSLLHDRSRVQSTDRVAPLVAQGIPCLVFEDISIEGVDFHCSPIVDHLLSLPVAKLCSDLLVLSTTACEVSLEQTDPTRDSNDGATRKIALQDVFRHCLWQYSSGVNRRQPLLLHPPLESRDSDENQPDYKEMWRQLIAKEASRYQGSFIRERLARCN